MIEVAGNLIPIATGVGGVIVGGIIGYIVAPSKTVKEKEDLSDKVEYLIQRFEQLHSNCKEEINSANDRVIRDLENQIKELENSLNSFITELAEKNYPDNIIFALKDAYSRISLLGKEINSGIVNSSELKREFTRIEEIIEDANRKMEKIKNVPTISPELRPKLKELNRILVSIDLRLLSELLESEEGKKIIKDIDRATLLSKEISENV